MQARANPACTSTRRMARLLPAARRDEDGAQVKKAKLTPSFSALRAGTSERRAAARATVDRGVSRRAVGLEPTDATYEVGHDGP